MANEPTNKANTYTYKIIMDILIFIGMFLASQLFGAADTTMKDICLSMTTNDTSTELLVIRNIRLPRHIHAVFVGAALAISGAIMQGITRNPLADPGLLGLTAGANAMLAITIVLFPSVNYFGIMIACFIGAFIGTVMVFSIGAIKKGGLRSEERRV